MAISHSCQELQVIEQWEGEMSCLPINLLFLEFQCCMSIMYLNKTGGKEFQLESNILLADMWHTQGEMHLLKFPKSLVFYYHRSPLSSPPPLSRNGSHSVLYHFPSLILLLPMRLPCGLSLYFLPFRSFSVSNSPKFPS